MVTDSGNSGLAQSPQLTVFLQENKRRPDESYCISSIVITIIMLWAAVPAPQTPAAPAKGWLTVLCYLFVDCIHRKDRFNGSQRLWLTRAIVSRQRPFHIICMSVYMPSVCTEHFTCRLLWHDPQKIQNWKNRWLQTVLFYVVLHCFTLLQFAAVSCCALLFHIALLCLALFLNVVCCFKLYLKFTVVKLYMLLKIRKIELGPKLEKRRRRGNKISRCVLNK